MRPLHKAARPEKFNHFDEILHSSEPAYAGRPIGGERESKDRKMDNFNGRDHLCNGLNISMNPSHYWQNMLFVSFSTSLKLASCPTYSSMYCEASFKSAKKYFKNQNFGIMG